jgi:hypothetical protein
MEDDFIKARNLKGGYASPKVKGGKGKDDFYKHYKKKGGGLSKDPFARIMRQTNKAVVEELMMFGEDYTLPHGIGRIVFRKRKNQAFMKDGKIVSNQLIDWKASMALWQENPQAKRNKILLKFSSLETGRYSFRIAMFGRKFNNKEYFAFSYKRSFKRAFAKRIKDYSLPKLEVEITKTI